MRGACHCGAVVFEVKEPPSKAIRCNCSYCIRRGWFTGYATTDGLQILTGEDSLSAYQFGAKTGTNYFCNNCGIHTHMYGTYNNESGYAYSIACIQEIDVDSLDIEKIDGKSF